MQPDSASAIQQIAIPRFTAELPAPTPPPTLTPMLNETAVQRPEIKGFGSWQSGNAAAGMLKPAANEMPQRWPASTRVNNSRAPADDQTLINAA
jgi:hypothetical protein